MSQHIYPSLAYEDAEQAIEWLGDAFGFERRFVVPGDEGILHAELRTDEGNVVMLLSTSQSTRRDRSPRSLGGTAQCVYVAVEDIDAAYERAVAAGADVFNPLRDTGYGREFCCYDLEGHIWTLGTYRPQS
jgi:uncharacterized glyoxalase superfamily protein PhnB